MASSVFISYRRKDWALAQLIARDLGHYIEVETVMDDRSIDGSALAEKLLPQVAASTAVVVVVTSQTFEEDRIKRQDDRLRRILAAAIKARRPVFPVYVDGARPRYTIPEDIRAVAWAEGVSFSAVSYESGLDKLAHLMAIQVGVARRQRVAAAVGAGAAVVNEPAQLRLITGDTPMLSYSHYTLPLLEWVNIPAGSLTLHTVVGAFEVPAYAISRYPVTREQYRAFINDLGYSDQRWWTDMTYPDGVELPSHDYPDHPVTNISWYEAVAFCRWLSHHTGLDIALPTEAQWQWSAHGEARTLYPWGDTFDLSRCNIKESGFGGTTPVTRFEGGLSPFGVADLSGNVWEWTSSEYDSPDREADLQIASPTLRGGSFEERMKHARTTSRARYYPHLRRHDLGFRLISRTWVG